MKFINKIIIIYLFSVVTIFASDFKIINSNNEFIKIKKIGKKELQINSIFLETKEKMYQYKLKIAQIEPFIFLNYKDFEEYKNEIPNKIIINYSKGKKNKNEILKIKYQKTNKTELQLIINKKDNKTKEKNNKKSNPNAVQCSGITLEGNRCKRMTTSKDGKCWQHK